MALILWTVVVYGVLRYLSVLFSGIFSYSSHSDTKRLVLMTENSQGSIEGVIRSYFLRQQLLGCKAEVVCVDTGSSDDTQSILTKLQQRYPSMEIRMLTGSAMTHPSLWGKEASVIDLRCRNQRGCFTYK
ncbi:hypothetical protein SAMN05444487_103144 [Marininema mesophilum]|uniref:Glycosyl transferase family 2 n=1 Tax=Marininema mesophilum TaxID=1048340 RepID=A0A1H2TID9_9BACL|nr:hypothetical protein [Marininema mesophilum]SDW43570.1 hypothetical protein SAMN05444487_103144 [Marininema mesophilum]